jgi:hypothetical protein
MHTLQRLHGRVGAFAALAAVLLSACDSTSPVDQAPAIEPGAPVAGQLESAADTAFYVARVSEGDTVRLFLQGTSGNAADVQQADLFDRSQNRVLASVTSDGTQAALDAKGSTWAVAPASGQLVVRVFHVGGSPTAPFRAMLSRQSRAPESRPAPVQVGEVTAGESFEHDGDADEFTFSGTAGDEMIVFYRPTSGATFPAWILAVEPNGEERALRRYQGVTTSLEENSSMRFRLEQTGVQRVVLVASAPTNGSAVAYEFRVYRVNRAPETGSAQVNPGAIVSDAIDEVGDVDEFTFEAPGKELNFFLQALDAIPAALRMEVRSATGRSAGELITTARQETLDELATGMGPPMEPGRWTVRVWSEAEGPRASATGRYRLEIYPINREPEHVSRSVLPTQAVTGERIDRLGDIDEFYIQPPLPAQVHVHARAQGTPGVWLSGVLPSSGFVRAMAGSGDEDWGATLSLAGGSTNKIMMLGPSATGGYRGPYTLATAQFTTAPESRDPAVAIGEWVEGEALDPVGEMDIFTFDARAGQVLQLRAERTQASTGAVSLVVKNRDPVQQLLAGTSVVSGQPSPRFIIPAAGRYNVEAHSSHGGRILAEGGPYRFRLDVVPTAPESAPAALVPGDSVAESIGPGGDIDDFVITAPPGSRVRVQGQTSFDPMLRMDIMDPVTGQHLVRGAGLTRFPYPLDVTVPAIGRVLVRLYEGLLDCCWVQYDITGSYWIRFDP